MELNALLAQPVALPSLPRAVALLMSELAQSEPSLRRLNQLFGTDPALAARLLELANSPTFQLPRQIAGIPEALALLGIAQLRTLVSSAPLGTTSRSVPGVNMQQFWRYSLTPPSWPVRWPASCTRTRLPPTRRACCTRWASW